MAFSFDEMFKKAKEVAVTTGKVVGEVVDDVVDSSKVKLAETKISGQIKEATHRLGMTVYDSHKTGKDSNELQMMIMDELNGLYETMEEIKKANVQNAGQKACGKCETMNAATACFCTACGSPLAEVVEDEGYVVSSEVIVEEEVPHVEVEIIEKEDI